MIDPLSLLEQLTSIPSCSGDESAIAQYLHNQLTQDGFKVNIDEVGNIIAETQSETYNKTIVLLGHMDTVAGTVPIRIENDLLYGRGAVDAKGALACLISAASTLKETMANAYKIIVVVAVQEESTN